MIRFVDLFCGIGGFRLGLERATKDIKAKAEYVRQENTQGLRSGQGQGDDERDKRLGGSGTTSRQCSVRSSDRQFDCVWSNDNDKYACQIYRKHWGENEVTEGDIREVDIARIPEFDLLCGGFPCQSFSIAGRGAGFEDNRGTLFFEIVRILSDKKPRYFLLENVRGLLSNDKGKTFQTILGILSDLGYGVQWQVLNSKDFEVPQNRERVFIIGHLRGKPRPKVFPIRESSMQSNAELAPAITSELAHSTGYDFQPNLPRIGLIRRLTPLECERLQGFPDGWTEGISDTQRYKCLGNAVTVNVIEAIGRKLLSELN